MLIIGIWPGQYRVLHTPTKRGRVPDSPSSTYFSSRLYEIAGLKTTSPIVVNGRFSGTIRHDEPRGRYTRQVPPRPFNIAVPPVMRRLFHKNFGSRPLSICSTLYCGNVVHTGKSADQKLIDWSLKCTTTSSPVLKNGCLLEEANSSVQGIGSRNGLYRHVTELKVCARPRPERRHWEKH